MSNATVHNLPPNSPARPAPDLLPDPDRAPDLLRDPAPDPVPARDRSRDLTRDPAPDPVGEAAQFIAAVQGDAVCPDLWMHLWYAPQWFTSWATVGAKNFAEVAAGKRNLYLCVGLAGERGTERQRLHAERAVGLLALPADIDLASEAHQKPNLPETEEDALGILAGMGVAPTVVVRTGHGVQALWCFVEPWHWDKDDQDTRARAMRLARGWQATLGAAAAKLGFAVDAIGDLARLIRPPGTLNSKPGCASVPVTLASCDPATRYTVDDLSACVTHWDSPRKAPTPRNAAPQPRTPAWTERRDVGLAPEEVRRVALKRYRKGLRLVREENRHRRDVLFWLARQLDSLGMAPCEIAVWVEDFGRVVNDG